MNKLLIALFLAFAFKVGYGQNHVESIPFEYTNSWMFINLKVNDSIEGKFIFDTGSRSTIVDWKFVEKANIPVAGGSSVKGLGEDREVGTGFILEMNLAYNKLKKKARAIHAIHLRKHVRTDGIDGIVGLSLFSNQSIELDFDNSTINVCGKDFNPVEEGYKPLKNITWRMQSNRLRCFVDIIIDSSKTVSVPLSFDTGSTGRISIGEGKAKEEGLTALDPIAISESYDTGLSGGKNSSVYISVNRLLIEDQEVDTPLVRYSSDIRSDDGLLGMRIIKEFNWFFDLKNGKFFFKPNNNFGREREEELKIRNIIFNTNGQDHYYVRSMLTNDQELTDIQAGDTILQARLKECGTLLKSSLLIDSINSYLNVPLTLTIKRGGKDFTKDITVKDVFLRLLQAQDRL